MRSWCPSILRGIFDPELERVSPAENQQSGAYLAEHHLPQPRVYASAPCNGVLQHRTGVF